MALLQCEIKSDSLRMETSFVAILPREGSPKPASGGTLYLLHGRGQSALSWVRYSGIELYAEKYDLAVIMPEGARSFYTDMRYGGDYFSYITAELPLLCSRMFRLEEGPEKTYVAGLSMGGYGALKCALNFPERYAGCGAFSAVTDIRWRIEDTSRGTPGYRDLQGVFGVEPEPGPAEDLFALAAIRPPKRPRLFISCGNEDTRLEQNLRLSSLLKEAGYDHEFQQWPGGHEWAFWELSLKRALQFFFGS
jgi:S-formylglutathione hydrolase FrmB